MKEIIKDITIWLLSILFKCFWVFKIKHNKIVIVSYFGKGYGDSGKYICEGLLGQKDNYDIVWLANDVEAKYPESIRVVKYNSIKSFYELATAKIWIDNCRKKGYISKRKGQYYIQTWHGGLGLKRIEAEAGDLDKRYIRAAKNDSQMINIMISNGKYRTNQYKKNFWYDGKIAEVGLPRNDALFKKVNKKEICSQLNVSPKKKIVLYAPTFRRYDYDYFAVNFEKLAKKLSERDGEDYMVLIRLHPNVAKKIKVSENETIRNASFYPDAEELIAISDYIISDYSSIIFDAIYAKKPVYLFSPDIDQYVKGRGFTFEYEKLPYVISKKPEELIDNICANAHNRKKKDLDNFVKEQGLCDDGKASERVCEIITKAMENKSEEI